MILANYKSVLCVLCISTTPDLLLFFLFSVCLFNFHHSRPSRLTLSVLNSRLLSSIVQFSFVFVEFTIPDIIPIIFSRSACLVSSPEINHTPNVFVSKNIPASST